jgi:hypothetical protein
MSSVSAPIGLAAGKKRQMRAYFLTFHGLVLLGYMLFGKAFAYIGVPPIYVGELALAVGCLMIMFTPRCWVVFRSPLVLSLVVLMSVCAVRTIPYVSIYGTVAFRDAALWGYGLFAVIVAGYVMANPSVLSKLVAGYSQFVTLFVLCIPVIWLLSTVLGIVTITVDGKSSPILKSTEIMSHLVGVVAYLYLGMRRNGTRWLLAVPILFVTGMNARAGVLSFCIGISLLVILYPKRRKLAVLTAVTLLVGTCSAVLDLRLQLPRSPRELSGEAVIQTLVSVYGDTGDDVYEATKRWRLEWWRKIWDYTWNGERFWSGKGFGINLADEDGFVLDASHSLRSPHNSHMTFLARAGVPGAVLWIWTQVFWAILVLRQYFRARRRSDVRWAKLFLFLFVYWGAFIVSAAFDVFLEGPMAGIWFWTIFGIGTAAAWIYQNQDVATSPLSGLFQVAPDPSPITGV